MIESAQAEKTEGLHLPERDGQIVVDILKRFLVGRKVWAFGSRATGKRLKKFSDLDLAVEGTLSWKERSAVSEAFDEALISFKVDLVELDLVDADFRARIEKDFVIITE